MTISTRSRAAVLPAPHGPSHAFYPQRRSHVGDRPLIERRTVPREVVSSEAAIYSRGGRPWKVVPMALIAVVAIVLLVNAIGGALRSNFPIPDPANYLGHVFAQAQAAIS